MSRTDSWEGTTSQANSAQRTQTQEEENEELGFVIIKGTKQMNIIAKSSMSVEYLSGRDPASDEEEVRDYFEEAKPTEEEANEIPHGRSSEDNDSDDDILLQDESRQRMLHRFLQRDQQRELDLSLSLTPR